MQQYLTYEAFGAVGDGVCDDMPAIVRAHAEAGRLGLPVRAAEGACYYISPKAATAVITTDTDWTGAKFIIDDRGCEDRDAAVFSVPPTEEEFSLSLSRLARGTQQLENPCGRDLFVSVENANHRDYIRQGLNQNNGFPRQDYLLLLADGSLSSAVSFDFDEVTHAAARPVEETALRLTGGEFTTIANPEDCTLTPYTATCRNIHIRRSNVEVCGLTHLVEGEGKTGTAYSGFLRFSDCARIRVHDCLFTAHYIYRCTGSAGKPVAMGSYDILCDRCVDIRFDNCRQTTDITDGRYWGLFSSNFCRDMVLENCIFSRYDTHMGVTNCILRGCTFGHQCINIIGNGSFLIEDTHVYAVWFAHLREDYGSTFRGDITVRNCVWHPSGSGRHMIYAFNGGRHDFGYTCYLPQELVIDGLTVEETAPGSEPLAVFCAYLHTTAGYMLLDEALPQAYLPVPPRTVTVKNLHAAHGIQLCTDPELLQQTAFTVL